MTYKPQPSSRTPEQQAKFIEENASVLAILNDRYPDHREWFLSLEESEVQQMRDAYSKTVSKHKQLIVSWPSFVLTCAGIALKLHATEDKRSLRERLREERHLAKLERQGRDAMR